jgi:methyl-accepting chemotaxis protein
MVEIRYREQYGIANLAGQTVSEAREQFKTEFGIPDKAGARLNDSRVKPSAELDTVLNDDDKLTFSVSRGKAAYLIGALLLASAATGSVFAFGFINASTTLKGLIFTVIALALLAIFLYGREISRGINWLQCGIFSPVINEGKRTNRALTRKIETTEKKMDSTEQALQKFAAAVAEYAQHLASHTSAIQGLAEASHELKKGAAEQNRVLAILVENVVKTGQKQETITYIRETPPPAPEKQKPEVEKPPQLAEKPPKAAEKPFHKALNNCITPGCARKRPPTGEEVLIKPPR